MAIPITADATEIMGIELTADMTEIDIVQVSEPVAAGGRVDYYNDEAGVPKTLETEDYRSVSINVNISTIDTTIEITIPDAQLTKTVDSVTFALPAQVAAVLRKWVLTIRSATTDKVLGNWDLFGRYGAENV